MKIDLRLLWCICLISLSFSAFAQSGNSWINYDLDYVKIVTGKDDIYRVSYESLLNAGLEVEGTNPDKIKMLHRGVQVAIAVVDNGDGVFGEDDYVEFYGRRHTGAEIRCL